MKKFIKRLQHTGLKDEEAKYLRGVDAITQAPVPVTSQLLILSFFVLLVAMLLWAVLSKIDIVSPAQGKTIPSSRIQLIQSPQLARVAEIQVQEGQRVQAGEILVALDTIQLQSEKRDGEARRDQLQARKQRIEALINAVLDEQATPEFSGTGSSRDTELQEQVMLDKWAMFNSELSAIEKRRDSRAAALNRLSAEQKKLVSLLPFSQNKVARMTRLHEKDGIPTSELEQAKEEMTERESSIELMVHQQREAQASLLQAKHEVSSHTDRFLSDLSQELTEVEQEILAVGEQLVRANDLISQYALKAPVSGIVKDIAVNTQGGVVQPADVLMQVVPENEPLEVEAKVLNRDIGFVFEGQEVNVKVDTFNFTKYGAIPGVIKHIASDTTEDEQLGPVYLALIELKQDRVDIGEREAQLVPGMTMTVDIHIGQRRLIEYVLNPVLRYTNEALRER